MNMKEKEGYMGRTGERGGKVGNSAIVLQSQKIN